MFVGIPGQNGDAATQAPDLNKKKLPNHNRLSSFFKSAIKLAAGKLS